ncbi:MAG: class I SAM-dependent methyltransferase [Chloroflexota bacterium]|nr:class I SAM-dependent methyltransferase [Chloroflexota bacterium]
MTDITDPDVERYASEHSSPEPPLLAELAEATRAFSASHGMMVGRLEGRFLKLLVAAIRARRVLEIGTFTGYSALSMAEGMPPDGEIISCELDERHAEMARRFIARSPYASRIDVRVGPALETIEGLEGPFDFVFIDADKTGYRDYYERALPLLSEGGLICIDNVLWSGRVVDPSDQSRNTVAMRELNDHIGGDSRVECVMLPIRDGVTLVRKR